MAGVRACSRVLDVAAGAGDQSLQAAARAFGLEWSRSGPRTFRPRFSNSQQRAAHGRAQALTRFRRRVSGTARVSIVAEASFDRRDHGGLGPDLLSRSAAGHCAQ